MVKRWLLLLCCCIGMFGCSTVTPSPGPTLLFGLSQYQSEMQSLGGSPARWPERQRAGGTLKTIVTATIGGSPEFYRLIDLDIKKREFVVTMRQTAVRADRMREMKEEMAHMNDEIAALKPVVRTQLAALLPQGDPEQRVENVATRGLLSLALDAFSSNGGSRGVAAPSTKVGQFMVTDFGGFTAVRAPDGQTFRCIIFGAIEDGAGIRCEPAK